MDDNGFLFEDLDIVAHLFFAAGTADAVRVRWNGGLATGVFRYPDPGHDGVFVALGGRLALPPGEPLIVEYEGPTDAYRFHTELVAADDEGLRVALPRAIDRGDRRLTPRVTLSPSSGVLFYVSGADSAVPCPVCDLSEAGLGFFDHTGWELPVDSVVQGHLDLGGGLVVPVAVQYRSIHPLAEGRGVGGRFAAISLSDRALLARRLVDWCAAAARSTAVA